MQAFLENVYNAINRIIVDGIKPYAISTKKWIKMHRERREDKREELITKILNFTIQGETVVTVPNFLSILRPFLIAIAAMMQVYGVPWYFVSSLVFVALITDKFDGAWAEIDGHTAFGEFLDPLCDKISLVIILLPFIGVLSGWVVTVMITIETILLIVAIVGFALQGAKTKENTNFRSNLFGKTKFFLQSSGICLLVMEFFTLAQIAFIIAIPFAVSSLTLKIYRLAKP